MQPTTKNPEEAKKINPQQSDKKSTSPVWTERDDKKSSHDAELNKTKQSPPATDFPERSKPENSQAEQSKVDTTKVEM